MSEADILVRLDRIDARLESMEGSSRAILVTRRTAAGMLGVSLRHFENLAQEHVATVRIGRSVLVVVADLERFVAERAR